MEDFLTKFVTKEVCQIKHKEVEEMKEEIVKLRECIKNKFSKLNALMFSVLSALIVNLVLLFLRK